jgi:hypothetical protein
LTNAQRQQEAKTTIRMASVQKIQDGVSTKNIGPKQTNARTAVTATKKTLGFVSHAPKLMVL